ncbi:MAG TPA: fasciclin domain-containing protein [Candidatus Limnocylindrales bacterium]|nr:fasciclin domain-containing protein [Candidatus Limnocylindrales bacterium]
MRKTLVLLALFSVLVLAVVPAFAQSNTIVDIAVNDGRFETLVAALTAADLVGALSGDGPFTVFAPTDDAFAALPAGTVDALLADIPALTSVLTYHVAPGKFMAADVVALSEIGTLEGSPISIEVTDTGVVLNGSVNVIITDIEASNGVIHVIDAVLLPPSMMPEESEDMTVDPSSITGIAVANGSFTTLVAALQAAGLDSVLAKSGSYTVLAPTDAAFAALPAGTVEALLEDIPALTNILLYHVVPGTVSAADVVTLHSADTLAGSPIYINAANGVVLNGSVNVTSTDIIASNGVIHVIDAVLLPPTLGLRDLVLVNVATPLLKAPGGVEVGGVIEACQTAVVFETLGGFGLTNFGAWINLADTTPVAADYGQPGGQPIAAECAA